MPTPTPGVHHEFCRPLARHIAVPRCGYRPERVRRRPPPQPTVKMSTTRVARCSARTMAGASSKARARCHRLQTGTIGGGRRSGWLEIRPVTRPCLRPSALETTSAGRPDWLHHGAGGREEDGKSDQNRRPLRPPAQGTPLAPSPSCPRRAHRRHRAVDPRRQHFPAPGPVRRAPFGSHRVAVCRHAWNCGDPRNGSRPPATADGQCRRTHRHQVLRARPRGATRTAAPSAARNAAGQS